MVSATSPFPCADPPSSPPLSVARILPCNINTGLCLGKQRIEHVTGAGSKTCRLQAHFTKGAPPLLWGGTW